MEKAGLDNPATLTPFSANVQGRPTEDDVALQFKCPGSQDESS